MHPSCCSLLHFRRTRLLTTVIASLSALLGFVSSLHLTGRGDAQSSQPPTHISGRRAVEANKEVTSPRRQPDYERSSKPVVNANCAFSSELRVDHSPQPVTLQPFLLPSSLTAKVHEMWPRQLDERTFVVTRCVNCAAPA